MMFGNKKEKEQKNQNQEVSLDKKRMRKIEIFTDGNNILLEKAEVSGSMEFVAILENLTAMTKAGYLRFNGKGSFKIKQEKENKNEDKK